MSQQIKTPLLAFSALLIVSVATYTNFSSFRPKALIPIREVQGAKTQQSKVAVHIPYPDKSEVLGIITTEETEQHTVKTQLSPTEIQDFYKNVLKTQGWTIDQEGSAGIFLNTEYKKEKSRIKITSSKDSDFSLISIEIIQGS